MYLVTSSLCWARMKTRQRNVSIDRLPTRRNTRSKTSFLIPIDLLIEIFSRLPVKSIAICRCVSKLWSSILVQPCFTELFFTMSSTRPQLLLAGYRDGNLFFFSLTQSSSQSSSHVRVNQLTSFDVSYTCDVLGLVHGFVGLINKPTSKGRNKRVPMICNPSTGQSLVLPRVKTRRVGVRSLFGYDPIGKEFKVLSMTRSGCNPMCEEHQVLTLGTGKRSWRMIECCVPHNYYPHREICIDGVLYYPSFNRDKETYLIVCFDVRSETFSVIKVKEPLYLAVLNGNLVNCNGKFGLVLSEGSSCITREKKSFQLWVLEDIEKQEWSEHTYLFPSWWKNMDEIYLLNFVGMTRTNEIVLLSYPTYYLFYFNLETKNIARVEFRGMDLSKYAIRGTFTDHVENVKFM